MGASRAIHAGQTGPASSPLNCRPRRRRRSPLRVWPQKVDGSQDLGSRRAHDTHAAALHNPARRRGGGGGSSSTRTGRRKEPTDRAGPRGSSWGRRASVLSHRTFASAGWRAACQRSHDMAIDGLQRSSSALVEVVPRSARNLPREMKGTFPTRGTSGREDERGPEGVNWFVKLPTEPANMLEQTGRWRGGWRVDERTQPDERADDRTTKDERGELVDGSTSCSRRRARSRLVWSLVFAGVAGRNDDEMPKESRRKMEEGGRMEARKEEK